MMITAPTAPADACSPDADRDRTDASAGLSAWVVHLLALVIHLILRHSRFRLPAWWPYRPDLPAGSGQPSAASTRGAFSDAMAWMCRRRGIGPGYPHWPELSRAIVAFGGSMRAFHAGLPACGMQWWGTPNAITGDIGKISVTPATHATASPMARQTAADDWCHRNSTAVANARSAFGKMIPAREEAAVGSRRPRHALLVPGGRPRVAASAKAMRQDTPRSHAANPASRLRGE